MKKIFNKSNIIGCILLSIGLMIYVLPIFVTVHKDYTDMWAIPWSFIGSGIAFLLIPDKIITGLGKIIDRKSDSL